MNRFLKDTLAAHDTEPALDGALQPRVQRLLQQTSMKLAQNELREWGKILLSHRPAVQAGIQSGRENGIMICCPCHIAMISGSSGRTRS